MDLVRFGRGVRALRIRRRMRQKDLAEEAGVSRSIVGRIEIGRFEAVPIGKVDKVTAALGAIADLKVNWNGEALDRLLDRAHAALVDAVVQRLRALGWEVAAEVTFWIRGERGSVDILAWHPRSRIVLVIEVKSIVPDIQGMLASLDRKARLAIEIARGRGWSPLGVGRLLVVGENRTSRRRIDAHAATFVAEYPHRGAAVRAWLRAPVIEVPLRGLWFLPNAHSVSTRHRVRKS